MTEAITTEATELPTLEALSTQNKGIEILVELAKSGAIDPWHIDVVDVTDKYLATLDVTRETDLRLSGRALFYAAVLLRLKSEALQEEEIEEILDGDDVQYDETGDELVIRPSVTILDAAIARRTSSRQPRKRPTTLVELIQELQRLESLDREGAMLRDTAMRRSRPSAEENRATVINMTHAEDLEGDIDKLSLLLNDWLVEHGTLTLSGVLAECPDSRGAFLALIFLDSRGKITLHQSEFYKEVTIIPEDCKTHGTERAA